jgi:LmbE family N-acetylglucosaminyl deacetylase
MQPQLKLMCIIAHPDDESLAMGGTLAKYEHEGVETSLVVATRGERGWRGPFEEHSGETSLGSMRERELREASGVLGVWHLAFLDYHDGDLDQADDREVVAKIATVLRIVRPHVVITFGPDGLYGHPDHIEISQFTTTAVLCVADPNYRLARLVTPHLVSKLYYRVATQGWFADYMPVFGELVMCIDGVERRATAWADWAITTRVDTSAYWRDVWQAVCCHQTQMPDDRDLQQLSEEDHLSLWRSQEYYRVFSLVNGGRSEEQDLFEGWHSR